MIDKDAFEAVGQMLRQKAPRTHQAYPHVIERLHWLWSAPEDCRAYLQRILVNESGDRQGFPTEVMAELLAINQTFERANPLSLDACDSWSLLDPRHIPDTTPASHTRATTIHMPTMTRNRKNNPDQSK